MQVCTCNNADKCLKSSVGTHAYTHQSCLWPQQAQHQNACCSYDARWRLYSDVRAQPRTVGPRPRDSAQASIFAAGSVLPALCCRKKSFLAARKSRSYVHAAGQGRRSANLVVQHFAKRTSLAVLVPLSARGAIVAPASTRASEALQVQVSRSFQFGARVFRQALSTTFVKASALSTLRTTCQAAPFCICNNA